MFVSMTQVQELDTAYKLGLRQSILQISSTSEIGNSNLGLRVVGPSRKKGILNIKTECMECIGI